jgi:DUF1365 family protein
MRSAVYRGEVIHARLTEPRRSFRYRLGYVLLDLDELDEVCDLHPLWSHDRPNVASFRRVDHTAVAEVRAAAAATGRPPAGPISILTQPRTLGWLFNPLSVWFVGDEGGPPAVVLEVSNTPWRERCLYAVARPGEHRFAKVMHVSPFQGMAQEYRLRVAAPGPTLGLQLTNVEAGIDVHRASLHLARVPLTRRSLGSLLRPHAAQPLHVSAAIYAQAARLWARGAPFHPHPEDAAA